MNENEYIIPTKEKPIFKALCSDFGFIERELYKDWIIKSDERCVNGYTYAIRLTDAITAIHEFISEYEGINKKSRFDILMSDGSVDKYGDPVEFLAYSINYRKAKLFKII